MGRKKFKGSTKSLALAAAVYHLWLQRKALVFCQDIKSHETILTLNRDLKAQIEFGMRVKNS